MMDKKIPKGFRTEELVRLYFYKSGFYVMRGVPISYLNCDMTDVDVWVYERSATLARRRMIVDVKDKRNPQAAERLMFVVGLAKILGVEGAAVATTEARPALRELAKKNGVIWLDNTDLNRIKSSDSIISLQRMPEEAFADMVAELDKTRGSKENSTRMRNLKSSVGDRFGASSSNIALTEVAYFADNMLKSHKGSSASQCFLRLAYLGASISAISMDFISADNALRPTADRVKTMANAIRFGPNSESTLEKMKWVEALIREYSPNSKNVSDTIRKRFYDETSKIPAEDLSEIVIKMSNTDRLFAAARELENAAYSNFLLGFDELSSDAKIFLGSVLDFSGINRQFFAGAWHSSDFESLSQNRLL